jgi:hypothetical protein
MHPRLCDDIGFSYATFNEKGVKRVRLDDFIPGLIDLNSSGSSWRTASQNLSSASANILAPRS